MKGIRFWTSFLLEVFHLTMWPKRDIWNKTIAKALGNQKRLSSNIVSDMTNSRRLINDIVAKITGYWCLKLR